MYKLVAAILLGNGVGGRMATAPHYNIICVRLLPCSRFTWWTL